MPGYICGRGIETGVFVELVHLFDIRITLCFVALGFICDSEYLFTMKVLISLLNWSPMAFRMSLSVLFVVPSELVLIHESRLNEDSIVDHSLFLVSPTPCCCVVPWWFWSVLPIKFLVLFSWVFLIGCSCIQFCGNDLWLIESPLFPVQLEALFLWPLTLPS